MMFESPPNNPIPGSSSGMGLERASTSRKRSMDDPSIETKRPRYSWYVKLESESSSLASEDDTESVYSIQGYETELIQDTPDTDTKSEYSSSSDVDFEVEYEVDDLSDEEDNPLGEGGSSSGTDDVFAAAAVGAIAAVICDNSMEAWATDAEDSDNSSAGDTELNHIDFWTCVQCKSHNNNPLFRYCQKCFQMRKNLFPPRPRGHRKRRGKAEKKRSQIASQQSAADSGVGSQESTFCSQDSIVGSQDSAKESQESDAPGTSKDTGKEPSIANTSTGSANTQGVKRKSECSTVVKSDNDSSKRSRTEEVITVDSEANGLANTEEQKDSFQFTKPESKTNDEPKKDVEFVKPADVSPQQSKYPLCDDKNLCIMCVSRSRNSAFVHANGRGCMECCYECAMRTWVTYKKCPKCTRKVKDIIRINKS